MVKTIQAGLAAKGKRFAIIASRFNEFITKNLLDGALDTLMRHGVSEQDVEVVWTPGSFEIPAIGMHLAKSKRFDAIICLGAIIRGSTPHFEYIASEAAKGVAHISLQSSIPAIFGIITADTLEQAIERAGTKDGNKGRDAALSAIEMANLLEKI